jgi:hypothetical protein
MKKIFSSSVVAALLVFSLGLPVASQAISDNQIQAEVQIVCPDENGIWHSGSGTIIDPKGIIITNRHVVTNEKGDVVKACFIGLYNSLDNPPDFGNENNRRIASVQYFTTSKDLDAAVLYIDNKDNINFPFINIWNSNSNLLKFGDKIEVVGYPGIGGSTITYSSGDFSGFGTDLDGTRNYIKSTAMLEHGNSGGSAFNSSGQFIGIPTMVVNGTLNSLSYILSVNSIKNWLKSSLGKGYIQDITNQSNQIEVPAQITQTSIQNDITPPTLKNFQVGFDNFDTDNNETHHASVSDDNHNAIFEFPKVRIRWQANCPSDYAPYGLTGLRDYCINDDDSGQPIKGYYYYFGTNKKALPQTDGKYISAADLIKSDNYWVKIPEIFSLEPGRSYFFILQAQDQADNLSNPLVNLEYIYEPYIHTNFNVELRGTNNKKLNVISVSKETSIKTNQKTLIIYPKFNFKANGFYYFISYTGDNLMASVQKGILSQTSLKISNINKHDTISVFLKPRKDSSPYLNYQYEILRIQYDKNGTNGSN